MDATIIQKLQTARGNTSRIFLDITRVYRKKIKRIKNHRKITDIIWRWVSSILSIMEIGRSLLSKKQTQDGKKIYVMETKRCSETTKEA